MAKLHALQRRLRDRADRQQRLLNLRRAVDDLKARAAARGASDAGARGVKVGDADAAFAVPQDALAGGEAVVSLEQELEQQQQQYAQLAALPGARLLAARLRAYAANNAALRERAAALKARNGELEAQYRKVVSLCTGVEEGRVEETLGQLLAAVESEGGGGDVEVGRVREFLRKVDGVVGG